MNNLEVIDSHVHLWDPARFAMPWLSGILDRAYSLADYREQTRDIPIAGIVYVEVAVRPDEALREARWIANLAAGDPFVGGIVAAAPLEQGMAVRSHLEALKALGPRIKGVRRNLQDEAPDFCARPDFVAGVRLLAEYDFSFDICVTHHQLPGVIELARRCPEVSFVLDHGGKPDIARGRLDPWRIRLRELASLANVQCKVSGLVTEADHARWQAADLAPFVREICAAFGEDRVMFGGDWPVVLLASPYRRWYEVLSNLTAHFSPAAARKFWSENARHFYRLATATQDEGNSRGN